MPAIKGPRIVHQYSNAFKVKAVQLAALSGGADPGCGERARHPSVYALALEEEIPGGDAGGQARRAGTDRS